MPVLKNQLARPAMREAVVLDLGDISAQAEKLRLAAEAKAKDIINEAQRRANELAQGAEERAAAQGFEEGRTKGFEQGVTEGHARALAETSQELQQVRAAFMDVATQWDAERAQLASEARQAVLEFALRLAEKVVHRVIDVDASVVVDQVAGALSHVLGPLDVTVHVHREDMPLLSEALPELMKELPHLEHVRLEPSAAVSRGGCTIAFGEGGVDATIEKQIERVVDCLLPLDRDEPETPSVVNADAAKTREVDGSSVRNDATSDNPPPPVSPSNPSPEPDA